VRKTEKQVKEKAERHEKRQEQLISFNSK
jgi:hypothetical protein